jgi:hypothetical protein
MPESPRVKEGLLLAMLKPKRSGNVLYAVAWPPAQRRGFAALDPGNSN